MFFSLGLVNENEWINDYRVNIFLCSIYFKIIKKYLPPPNKFQKPSLDTYIIIFRPMVKITLIQLITRNSCLFAL